VSQETCHRLSTSNPGRGATGERWLKMTVHATPVLSIDRCDPHHLIRDALCSVQSETWSANELYLAWLMNLPLEVDAADAEALLLGHAAKAERQSESILALLALLRTTTAYPRERLEPGLGGQSHLH